MDATRFRFLTACYANLRVGVIGDVCLDRYLEIDAALDETSLETGRAVHNVTTIRSQPGAAGTVINNLAALGIGRIDVFGWCGLDGEGWELQRALGRIPGIALSGFIASAERRTFAYTKPMMCDGLGPPRELDRLDFKNWTPTPESLSREMAQAVRTNGQHLDALVIMDQADRPGTGVITDAVLAEVEHLAKVRPHLPIIADSRPGLARFPAVIFKMNHLELARLLGSQTSIGVAEARLQAAAMARRNQREVVVTLAGDGVVSAQADGATDHVAAHPLRGMIDVVGAGDSVTANLAAALGSGASIAEAAVLANAAASVVIHQLGTTGTASLAQIGDILQLAPAAY